MNLNTSKSDFPTELQQRLATNNTPVHEKSPQGAKRYRVKDYHDQNLAGRDLQEGDPVWMHNPQRKKGLTPKQV
jgi:hypothetical protein